MRTLFFSVFIIIFLFPLVSNSQTCNNWLKLNSQPSFFRVGDLDVTGNKITVEATFNRTTPWSGSDLYQGDLVSKHEGPNDCNYLLRPGSAEITTTTGYYKTPSICQIELNKTYHAAMVYDGSTLKFYRNGFLMSQIAATGNLVQNNWQTQIGLYFPQLPPENFIGYINEVRIWNTVRTQSEIRTYMNQSLTSPQSTPGLLAYYIFDNLLNKQGNPIWDGTLSGSAFINETNPNCNLIIDSCNVICPPPPAIDFSYNQKICSPKTIQFSASLTGDHSYLWTFGDGQTNNSSLNPTVTFNNYGSYTVNLRVLYGNNCFTNISKNIPVDNFFDNTIIQTLNSSICLGDSIQLTSSANNLTHCWQSSNGQPVPSSLNAFVKPTVATNYYLNVQTIGSNLVVNGDFSSGNTAFTSDYVNAFPNITEGQYLVGNNPQTWNPSLGNCTDHTSGNSNMMMVNGSPTPDAKIWSQTVSVTPNTNYAFSTWIQSLYAINPANLKFSINNVAIGDNITAGTLCSWNKFHTTWNSGSNTTAIITIINNNTIVLGNDFALDDIFFGPIIFKNDSIKVNVNPLPFVKTIGDTTLCNGHSVSLYTTGATSYSWSPTTGLSNANTGNPLATPGSTTDYIVTGTDINGCKAKDTVQIAIGQCTTVIPDFSIPDTVCVNTPINIINTSKGASTYYWNFCVANINEAPDAVNIGNPGGLSSPVFIDYAYYNGNHYGFLINYHPGKLIRLNFGNSLLNIPTTTDLGNFGGILPSGSGTEGIQIVYNEEKWYAIIVGGTPAAGNSPRLVKIDFGPDLTNPNPIPTNWGNIGNMLQPIDLHVFNEGGNWYGFTVNAENNTITRFNFTNSFNNIPTAINLGNVGNLQYPTGIYAINDNGFWRVFIVNGGDNTRLSSNCSLTRLDFGSSLLNMPLGVNLGNPGNYLQHPRDLTIMKLCNQIIGYVVNGNPNYNDILKIDFNNNLLAIPSISSLGNIGNFNFPHSISKLFRVENDVYGFITNVANNTITRLKFNGCNSSSVSNSNQYNPPQISYSDPGIYFVNLTIDDGLPTQSTICKQIVVVSGLSGVTNNLSTCKGNTIKIGSSRNSDFYLWSTGATTDSITVTTSGIYWVDSKEEECYIRDTMAIHVIDIPIISLGNDTAICKGDTLVLNAFSIGAAYEWQDLSTGPNLLVTDSGIYKVNVFLDGCTNQDSIHILYNPEVEFTILPINPVCNGESVQITSHASDNLTYKWYPETGMSNSNIKEPIVTVSDTIMYTAIATNSFNCKRVDSVVVFGIMNPYLNLGADTSICPDSKIELNVQNTGSSYYWNDGSALPIKIIDSPGLYYVSVAKDGCNSYDSIIVSLKAKPEFKIIPDALSVCKSEMLILKSSGGDTYEWYSNGMNLNMYDSIIQVFPETTTTYSLIIKENQCGYSDTLYSNITINPLPIISISKSNDVTCKTPESKLLASGGIEYKWAPSININNTNIPNPIVRPSIDTWYKVAVKDENGCTGKDSIMIFSDFTDASKFYIPNAFTPNHDGKNDCFGVTYWSPLDFFELSIFNRWGEKVFFTNKNECWNGYYKGKLQPEDVYVYIINAKGICGNINRKGSFVLLR